MKKLSNKFLIDILKKNSISHHFFYKFEKRSIDYKKIQLKARIC